MTCWWGSSHKTTRTFIIFGLLDVDLREVTFGHHIFNHTERISDYVLSS